MHQPENHARPIVFDVGMNVGGNIAYYLKKGYRVVGIDANPQLVDLVRRKFESDIAEGNLTLVNGGVGPQETVLPFFVNTRQSGLSSFAAPDSHTSDWQTLDVPVRPLSSLIREHGAPAFVKIDVEGFDAVVLRDLLLNEMTPPSVSVEVHGLQAVCCLVTMGYTEFQLVNCAKIGRPPYEQQVRTLDGAFVGHRFAEDSAGPFGDDLVDQWVPSIEMVVRWFGKRAVLGFGWYDLHARSPKSGGELATGVGDDARVSDVLKSVGVDVLRSKGRRFRARRRPIATRSSSSSSGANGGS